MDSNTIFLLVVIAVFSFKLLFEYHDMPKPYMTVKATGNQWNWSYEYPDQKIGDFAEGYDGSAWEYYRDPGVVQAADAPRRGGVLLAVIGADPGAPEDAGMRLRDAPPVIRADAEADECRP